MMEIIRKMISKHLTLRMNEEAVQDSNITTKIHTRTNEKHEYVSELHRLVKVHSWLSQTLSFIIGVKNLVCHVLPVLQSLSQKYC